MGPFVHTVIVTNNPFSNIANDYHRNYVSASDGDDNGAGCHHVANDAPTDGADGQLGLGACWTPDGHHGYYR